MKNVILVFFAILLLACQTKKDNKISLFNDYIFRLDPAEHEVALDFKIKERYAQNFKNTDIQVPLFKAIKGENYEILIGVPFNTSIEALTKAKQKQDSLTTDVHFDHNAISFYKKYKKENLFVGEYAKNDDKSLIYLLLYSSSKDVLDTLNLANRIKLTTNE
ncbi:MAG: hypothetical protein ACK5MZ_11545 [Aestuariibaculum sp.]